MPAADIDVDDELVDRLVRDQHPDLAGPLRRIGTGWDNVIYRLGDDHCVRLPRRRVAADLLRNEQRWLPLLASWVDVPVPAPVRIGVPSDAFPWWWSVTRWLPGRPGIDVPVAERNGIAVQLAAFLADLHRPAPSDAPVNPFRGVPLYERSSAVLDRLDSGLVPDADRLRTLWLELLDVPAWGGPPLWLHGDPHPANLLVDDAGGLAAVIDFGDVTAGDPATDYAAGWLVFDVPARAELHAELRRRGAVDPATWQRARGWALIIGTALATSSADHPPLASVAERTLAELLS